MAQIEIRTFEKPEIDEEEKPNLAATQLLYDVAEKINSDENLDLALDSVKESILSIFDAERITVYFVDKNNQTIFSKFKVGNSQEEIRIPVSHNSVAGYVADTENFISIMDAYNELELLAIYPDLKFDKSWDGKSGFRTRQVMAHPLMHNNRLMGVVQLINKKHGDSFTSDDWSKVRDLSEALGGAINNQELKASQYKTRFDYLTCHNIISQHDLENAMTEAREQKCDVGDTLMKTYNVKKSDLGKSLSAFYGVGFFACGASHVTSKELLARLNMKSPFKFMEANGWAPFREKDGSLHIICSDPSDYVKVGDIKRVVKNRKIELYVGLPCDINRIISQLEGKPQVVFKENDDHDLEMGKIDEPDKDDDAIAQDTSIDEIDVGIIKLVNNIIIKAYNMGVSDIHIETYPGDDNTVVRFRRDGMCFNYKEIPAHWKRAVIARIKIMSNLDIAERRLPQDGKIKFVKNGKSIELRVATVPTFGGNEDAVLRILSASKPLALGELNFHPKILESFKRMVSKPYGIFLVVGPTGSGKTTTLHSALAHINTPERKIWTAEDPVEITQHGLRQVQMHAGINLTFATAMRSFLRADPDVIMVGEIRDHETASMGIEASLTGHLVMSTLHTNSAAETVTRLIDLGMDPFNFADALLGVVAQRLVRTLCPFCKERYSPGKDELKLLAEEYGEQMWPEMIETTTKSLMGRAKGCRKCNNTGYKGRTALHEALEINPEIKRLVQTKSLTDEIREASIKNGMRTLKQDGIWKVLKGDTDIESVRAVCSM